MVSVLPVEGSLHQYGLLATCGSDGPYVPSACWPPSEYVDFLDHTTL